MADAGHTPTPWHISKSAYEGEQPIAILDHHGDAIAHVLTLEDAAFIVLACNSHADLAAALREFEISLSRAALNASEGR